MWHLRAQAAVAVDSALSFEVKSRQSAVTLVPKSTSSQICTCVCMCVWCVGGWGMQIDRWDNVCARVFMTICVTHVLRYNTRSGQTGRGWLDDSTWTAHKYVVASVVAVVRKGNLARGDVCPVSRVIHDAVRSGCIARGGFSAGVPHLCALRLHVCACVCVCGGGRCVHAALSW